MSLYLQVHGQNVLYLNSKPYTLHPTPYTLHPKQAVELNVLHLQIHGQTSAHQSATAGLWRLYFTTLLCYFTLLTEACAALALEFVALEFVVSILYSSEYESFVYFSDIHCSLLLLFYFTLLYCIAY
jgi:hypothetical protein